GDGFVGGGQWGGVGDVVDGRAGISCCRSGTFEAGVLGSRCAEVGGWVEFAGDFHAAAVDAHEDFGPAANPTGFGAKEDAACRSGGEDGGAYAVGAVVAAGGGAEVDAVEGAVVAGAFDGGVVVGALEDPVGGAGFEAGVVDDVGAAVVADFDVVNEAFAKAEEEEFDVVGNAGGAGEGFAKAVLGAFEVDPLAFGGFVGVGPVGRLGGVGAGIGEFEAAAAAVGPAAPAG